MFVQHTYNADEAVRMFIESVGGNPQTLPDEFEYIRGDQDPVYPKWKLIPYYKRDNNGNVRVWQVGFDGLYIWTLYGPTSKTTISTTLVVTNTSNRNLSQQAKLQCLKLALDKYRKGYQSIDDGNEKYVVAMKGNQYKDGCVKTWPMLASFKLNGIRLLASWGVNGVKCLSYHNKSLDHITHIKEQLENFMPFLPPGCTLDGELYNHNMQIHEIQSAVSTNVNYNPDIKRIIYYIFDIYWEDNPPMDIRKEVIENAYNSYIECDNEKIITHIRFVPHVYVNNEEELFAYKEIATANGYEGLVLRHSAKNRKEGSKQWEMSRYKFERSNRMYKLKDYLSDEGIVIRVEATEGKEKDLCKLVLQNRNGHEVTVRFSDAENKRMWRQNNQLIIGQVIEYSYTHLHPRTGKPQQPKAIRIRESTAY